MRKLIVHEFMSLDGVIQAPGGRTRTATEASSTVAGRGRTGTDGSSQLVQTLLEHDFVDELYLTIYPLVLGAGKRIFPEGLHQTFRLISAAPYPTGVVGLRYARANENEAPVP